MRGLTDFAPIPNSRTSVRFTIAVSLAGLAILLRWLLDPLLGHVAFYTTIYIAVAFCALLCGAAPATISAIVGFLGIFHWFVDPRLSVTVVPTEIHGTVGFVLVSAVLIALGQANRSKQLRLNAAVAALTEEAEQRKAAQMELRAAHDLLEQRVRERTQELSHAMAGLESEIKVREQTEERLRQLSLRLMTLQDDERRRIARELHDTAGQTLAAIKMSIAMIRHSKTLNEEALLLVDDLDALTDAALQEVRTASYLLHPPLLDEVGIASAIRWFVQGFAERSGIQVQCEIGDLIDRPTRHCEIVLFRVLQESLTNVHRHSGASAVSVRLRGHQAHVMLEICDDGHGMSPERLLRLHENQGPAGVGITGMRERVRELGGTFEISSDEKGTTVNIALPVLKSAPEAVSASQPA